MPFEPRLFAHDDESPDRLAGAARADVDEFDSPDLEVLAAQLSDDAAYLAKLYPPRTVRPVELPKRRFGASVFAPGRWRVASVMLWIAGTAAVWSAWGLATRGEHRQVAAAGDTSADQLSVIGAGTFRAVFTNNLADLSVTPRTIVSAALLRDAISNSIQSDTDFSGLEPGDLLQDLSASEQEAVFDLLESEPIEQARLSL